VSSVAVGALVLPLAAPATAAAQTGAGEGSETAVLAVAILLGGAGLLFLAAATLGYGEALGRRPAAARPAGPRLRRNQAAPPPREPRRRVPRFPRLPVFTREVQGGGRRQIPQPGDRRAVGYTTFPDRRRAVSPESRYEARRIRAACDARALVLQKLVGDVQSYSGPDLERPGLRHALELLEGGDVGCIVVTGLDRLSRSAANLGTLIERLEQVDARLIVIDIELDTDTDEGRMAARTLIRVGSLERRRDDRPDTGGFRRAGSGGRPAVADLPLLQRRIATMRANGMTLQAIADTLNQEGVPTLRGGAKWRPSSVQAATGYRRPSQRDPEDQPHP
jgi:DNA invertase Pin-like site-specific DNA recombinase